MTSYDVIKLAIVTAGNWSRAEHARRTAGASTWQHFLRMRAEGAQGAVRSSRLWVGHGAAGAAGTGESAGCPANKRRRRATATEREGAHQGRS